MLSLIETGAVVLEKKRKLLKVYDDDDDDIDDRQILIKKANMRLRLRLAKNLGIFCILFSVHCLNS